MAQRRFAILVSVLLTAVPSSFADVDFFSSTLRTKRLLETHEELLTVLQEYASAASYASEILDWYLSESEVTKVSGPWPNDGDPLRTYVLIRRMTSDLDNIVHVIRKFRSLDPLMEVDHLRQKRLLPSSTDMNGITTSLIRLQKTYLLKPMDLIQGKVSNTLQLPVTLSALDCLKLGEKAEELSESETIPVHAKLWYEAGLQAYQTESREGIMENKEVLEDLQIRLQDIENGIENGLFTKIPDEFQDIFHDELLTKPLHPETASKYVDIVYRRLCRGENLRAPSMDASNKCHLRQGPHPYMKIRPLKVEVKCTDPYLVVLHDIIGDTDIRKLKTAAIKKAIPSAHFSKDGSKTSFERVSITSWLKDDIVPCLAKRLGVFLGMNSNAKNNDVENFQVLNYGVGGHYALHRDYYGSKIHDGLYNLTDDRIATLMLYLSDVEEGGLTAFPYAGVAFKPIKGSAAFWWNLRSDGSGDYPTTHGACPVIYGTKWVSNKWFQTGPQMFRVPCGLQAKGIINTL